MKSYFETLFVRGKSLPYDEIVKWWNKGRCLLNLIFLIYVIIYFSIIVIVFKNGWIVFLLPIIFCIFILINILFSMGLFFELIAIKIFKTKIDFYKIAPEIKKWTIALIALFILILSVFDILNQ